jgi:hypothetical protein
VWECEILDGVTLDEIVREIAATPMVRRRA